MQIRKIKCIICGLIFSLSINASPICTKCLKYVKDQPHTSTPEIRFPNNEYGKVYVSGINTTATVVTMVQIGDIVINLNQRNNQNFYN